MRGVNTTVPHRKDQLFLLAYCMEGCCLHGLGQRREEGVCLSSTIPAETSFLGQRLLGMVMLAALEKQPAVQLIHKVAASLGNDHRVNP